MAEKPPCCTGHLAAPEIPAGLLTDFLFDLHHFAAFGSKKQKFNLNGQLLHAFRLTLTHPRTGERMTFEAPLPAYFRKVLDALRGRAGDGGEKA